MIQSNYSLDLLSLLPKTTATLNTTATTTNFNDILQQYMQTSSTNDVSSLLAATDTTSAKSVSELLGANSTYAYYLNSLLGGSTSTPTEAMQTYLMQSNIPADERSTASLFGGATNATSSSTLSTLLMAQFDAQQMQHLSAAKDQYETQLTALQQVEQPNAAITKRIDKLQANMTTLTSYIDHTLTAKKELNTSAMLGSVQALQQNIFNKYAEAQQAAKKV